MTDRFTFQQRAEEKWNEVKANYENHALHERFIVFCQRNHNLEFAAKKYQSCLDDHPDDPIALKFKQQVKLIAQFRLPKQSSYLIDLEDKFEHKIRRTVKIGVFFCLLFFVISIAAYFYLRSVASFFSQ